MEIFDEIGLDIIYIWSNLKIAISVANKICEKGLLKEGWFKTVLVNKNEGKRMRELPTDSAQKTIMYLKPQAHAALAMLQLYQFTHDTVWLYKCKLLKNAVINTLNDNSFGGFLSTNLTPVTLGEKKASTKVLTENALFAKFLIEYNDLLGEDTDEKIIEATLKAIGNDKILKNEERLIADYNLVLGRALKHHLVFTVVSRNINSTETKKLIQLMQAYYHPQKLMKVEAPGHYPDLGEASLFVCSTSICSQPIKFGEQTTLEIDAFIKKVKD